MSKIQQELTESEAVYNREKLRISTEDAIQQQPGDPPNSDLVILDIQWNARKSFLQNKLSEAQALGEVALSSMKHKFVIMVICFFITYYVGLHRMERFHLASSFNLRKQPHLHVLIPV